MHRNIYIIYSPILKIYKKSYEYVYLYSYKIFCLLIPLVFLDTTSIQCVYTTAILFYFFIFLLHDLLHNHINIFLLSMLTPIWSSSSTSYLCIDNIRYTNFLKHISTTYSQPIYKRI